MSDRISRQAFLRRAAVGGGALAVPGWLAARAAAGAWPESLAPAAQPLPKTITFSHWPLYIDTDHGKRPSLTQFTKQTGITVNYKEVIQDNAPFYAKIAPTLQAGQPGRTDACSGSRRCAPPRSGTSR